MTYATFENSVQDGQPVYKFLFVQGATEYRYTTASYFISDSAGTWEPSPLSASSVSQSGEMAKNGIKVVLPRTNAVAILFLGGVPEETMTLTVYRGHTPSDLDDFRVMWKGRIAAASASNDAVTLQCEDIFTSMRRPGLRARYQKGCRHALYSPPCGVDKADFGVNASIESASGFNLTFLLIGDSTSDSNSSYGGDGYFSGGIAQLSDGTMRYITNHSGSTLTLISPFNGLDVDSVGVTVTLYPGCRHNTSDCKNKFNNLLNYGGFPYIPGKNPFSNSVSGSIA